MRIAHVAVGDLLQRLVAVLLHGQHVGQHLGRVKGVGQTVPDRYAGVLAQGFDRFLGKAAIFDAVIHAPQHARRILG